MAKGIVDTESLKQLSEDYGEAVIGAAGRGMERALNILEAQAVELAPVDVGNLEGSTSTKIFGRGTEIIGVLTFATPYAGRVHETGSPGPKTQLKAGTELGTPGIKYLERPLRAQQVILTQTVAKFIRDEVK